MLNKELVIIQNLYRFKKYGKAKVGLADFIIPHNTYEYI